MGVQLPLTFDQFDIVKILVQRVFTLLALAAIAWAYLIHGGRYKYTKFEWLILAFLGWVLLTSFLSVSPATAFFGKYRRFEGFFSFVNYAAVFWLAIQLVDTPAKMRAILRTLFFSSVLVVAYGLLQYFGGDLIKWGQLPFEVNRSFSFYGNPDLLGGFLVLVLPITLALALTEEQTIWRAVYWAGFLFTVWVWISSFVRGAWIGGTVALLILVGAAVWSRFKPKAIDWGFLGATGLTGIVLIVRSMSASNDVMNFGKRLVSIAATNEGSSKTRFEIWQAAVDAIKDRPLFGFGPDTFRLVFPKYKPVGYTADAGYLSVADNVHNYPLQLTAGVGIPGFLMLYGLIAWVLTATARHAFARGSGANRLLYASVWAGVVGYMTHLMFGLSVTGSTVFLWLFLGLLAVPLARSIEFEAPSWGNIAGLVVTFVFIALAGYWMWWGSADYYYLVGRIAPVPLEQRIQAIKTSIDRNPWNDMYRAELALRYQDGVTAGLTQAQQQQPGTPAYTQSVAAAQSYFGLAEQALLDTIAFVPTEYDNYVFLTNLYNQGGSYFQNRSLFQKAVEIGRKGMVVEPFGPAIMLHTAIGYRSLGQPLEAEKLLVAAAKLDPNFTDVRSALAQAYLDLGKKAEALALAKELVKLAPDNAQFKQLLKQAEASSTPSAKPSSK
jgi:O-antigen ligase